MDHPDSPVNRLRQALQDECPLQVVGVPNALCAKLAERAGFRCLYLSGAGVANVSLGLPDLGMTTLEHVVQDARRITAATDQPLLVDCDTGWETTSRIATTVTQMESAGVAAIHLEDQAEPKRCGHRPGKRLVSVDQMRDRLKAVTDARQGNLAIMARTDAAADEGVDAAIDRACKYVAAGADLIFAEALTEADQFRQFCAAVDAPVLANMTEFGRSPLLSTELLNALGVRMVLYPLTAMRMMNAAAERAYLTLRSDGIQTELLEGMQTREELYELLDYYTYEKQIDADLSNSTRSEE